MRTKTLLVLAALGLAAPVATWPGNAVQAQEVNWRDAQRGWIGISFEVTTDRWGRAREVVVTDVSLDSPAQRGGVRPGDRIIAINELTTVRELGQLNQRLHLAPGDDVVMQVIRDGRRQELHLEAAPRPDAFQPSQTVRLRLEADSMVETWVRAMDSLKVELIMDRGGNLRVEHRVDAEDDRRITVIAGSGRNVISSTAPAVRAPFEFFVFRGEATDSLEREMAEINRVASELEERLSQRERQIRRRAADDRGVDLGRDYQYRQLTEALRAVENRSAQLEMAMADAARETAGERYVREPFFAPQPERTRQVREVREANEFRPLTPYLLGRNRVAGAEVIDLREELARYFNVGNGVLVVDVAPGTPAAIAGIVPGDVITRIDQVGVRSVEDLRFGISMAGDTIPIALIREGSSVQVLLRR